ncbi:MAG: cation-translocating P-type ATPase [Turicibacter sp.]|nr:cation-translocating P-type ATPase [Turicibacter sp.]
MLWTKDKIDEVIKRLDTNVSEGLTQKEAESRIEKYGLNEFEAEKKETLFAKIMHHLLEISAIILLVAAGIAAYMAITTGDGWAKVWVILGVVIINTFLGIYQEGKAEAALDALKKLNSFESTVIRDGEKKIIDASKLVPGDIIELVAGDMISADARLIDCSSLAVDESGLTGESVPVEKDHRLRVDENTALGDRKNMVYSGCLVTAGRGKAVVVETAMETEMGKIAKLLNNTKKQQTPLQLRLKKLSINLSVVALAAGALIFAIGVLVHGDSVAEMLLVAVALGVAAVPEALPIIVTMILARGVHSMVVKNTIIKRIPAVETVGNTSVICSDKTGTLTMNKMRIQRVWHVDHEPKAVEEDFNDDKMQMLEYLGACTNAVINVVEGKDIIVGDPTEASIVRLMRDKGLTRAMLDEKYPRVHEIPFDSDRKLMTTIHKMADGYLQVTKGAFDRLPVRCNSTEAGIAVDIHDSFAEKALRVITVGIRKWRAMPEDLSPEHLEISLEFIGMIGMIDPPRPESKEAVRVAKEAGIKTVMITGDHILTAKAIAEEIGIYEAGDRAITGVELEAMSEDDLRANVRNISVYARVSPEDKIRIVQAWQSQGEVITMTGDGVNDAPALKAADVGAAMGITGTEVSKNAADMVITDDNFATIVDAVAEGRTSYDNIRKTVSFLLSVNFAQIFIMLIGVILGWGPPVVALQLLFINVVSDGIPGLFISQEKAADDIMQRKPIKKDAGIFSGGIGTTIAFRGSMFVILTLTAFWLGMNVELSDAITPSYEVGVSMAFIVLSWASVINIFNVRSEKSIFKIGLFSNPHIFFSALGSVLVTLAVATIAPLMSVFEVVALSGTHWAIVVGLALMQLVVVEIVKAVRK